MPFAKSAKATPTYFRALPGALPGRSVRHRLDRQDQRPRSESIRLSSGSVYGLGTSRQARRSGEHPHAASAAVGSTTARECAVQLLRSSCHLPVRTARVARLVASFSWLPACLIGVANSASSSGDLLRQVRSGFEHFVGMQAPLALRTVLRGWFSALPGNKQNNFAPAAPDAARRAGFYGRYAALRPSSASGR